MSASLAFVLPSFADGGAERVALNLLARLDRSRFDPRLIVLDGQGPLAGDVPTGVLLTDLKTPRLRHALPRLIGALRDHRGMSNLLLKPSRRRCLPCADRRGVNTVRLSRAGAAGIFDLQVVSAGEKIPH
jgi:hypothetical protein